MDDSWHIRVAVWLAAAFFSGSIPWGYLVVRLFYKADIREKGSGNIGMTNVMRVYGMKPGLFVFALDIAKGLLPVVLCSRNLDVRIGDPGGWTQAGILMAVALAAVLGAVFTPWLGFKGGKGIGTGLGVLTGLLGWAILIPLLVFAAAFIPTKYVSLGSLCATFAFLLVTIFLPQVSYYLPAGIIFTILIFYTHRENIKRLVQGKESKLSLKRNK